MSDASVQTFSDIARTLRKKHSTDKMFWLLEMESVSPNTKKSITNAILNDFRSCSSPVCKRQKSSVALVGLGAHHLATDSEDGPVHFGDYVTICSQTSSTTEEDNEDTSVMMDPDNTSKNLFNM
jgi:hypothetical protein